MRHFDDEIRFTEGFIDAQPPRGLITDALGPGSKDVYPEGIGLIRSWNGTLAIGIAGSTNGTTLHSTVNGSVSGGINGPGSVFNYQGSAIGLIGSGVARRNGVTIGTATAQMQFFVETTPDAFTQYVLGLDAPSAPVLALGASVVGKLYDTVSAKFTVRRSETGGESNPSGKSNIFIPGATGKKVQVTFPSAPASGARFIRVYFTFQGYATGGSPYFMYPQEFEYKNGQTYLDGTAGTANSYLDATHLVKYLDFDDADLLAITPPTNAFKPFDGSHGFALGPYLVVAGVLPAGGWGIHPSLPNRPDAYDPDHVVFLNPGEAITACVGRATDGFQYIACRDSLHAAILSGDPSFPILVRVLWGNDGFPTSNAVCQLDSELIGISSRRGPVRTQQGEEPDRTFAQKVARYMENWDPANVVVGFDEASNMVVFAHGTEALAYMRGLDGNQWSAPLTLPLTVTGRTSYQGRLYLRLSDGNLYRWNAGSALHSAGGVFIVTTPYRQQAPNREHTITGSAFESSHSIDVRYLANQNGTVAAGPETRALVYGNHTSFKQQNIPRLRSYGLDIRGAGVSRYVYGATLTGLVEGAEAF